MEYISGVQALNIDDSLETCGDWHQSAIQWTKLDLRESEGSLFGDYGIEENKEVPKHEDRYNVANVLRAILDLMSDGHTRYLKGFYDDFICTDKYNIEFFEQVQKLKDSEHWDDINKLMKMEFMWEWDEFIGEEGKAQVIGVERDLSWIPLHKEIMIDFLDYLNGCGEKFVLKGGTALMLCYGLPRFSDKIELEGKNEKFFELLDRFVEAFKDKYGTLSYTREEDTNAVRSAIIQYGASRVLRVKVSYRGRYIDLKDCNTINGILVYSIEEILSWKWITFGSSNSVRDLYDMTFIYLRYNEILDSYTIKQLRGTLAYMGIEKAEYLIKTQPDELINTDELLEKFSQMYYALGLS